MTAVHPSCVAETMRWHEVLVWSLGSGLAMAIVFACGQSLGLTRLDIPFLLGTAVTSDRDRAKIIGHALNLGATIVFGSIYILFFEIHGHSGLIYGAEIGLIHGLAVLMILVPLMPGIHPRMVTDSRGPEPTRLLQPPGFFGINYGRHTPWVTLTAHVVFGCILGTFYTPR